LLLAGSVLAHAAWSISDAPDLLVPLAIVERNGQREVMRFEADTQPEAIAHGKAKMATLSAGVEVRNSPVRNKLSPSTRIQSGI